MAQVMVNFRQDEETKSGMEDICRELGFSPSVAYNMFAKKVIRERRIPFEISIDPFYSESNMNALRESAKQIQEGLDELSAMEDKATT